MSTTKEEIRSWLKSGKKKGASHVLVVCDTYDWWSSIRDYPVFVMPGEDVHKKAAENSGPNMTKLMEVYNLSMDFEKQLNEHRAFNY